MNNITQINGDLLEYFDKSKSIAIGHVCNCQGVMGSGIAHAIKMKYPQAYENYVGYKSLYGLVLGTISTAWSYCGQKVIVNLHAQQNYGTEKGKQYLDYSALAKCLNLTQKLLMANKITLIGFPYKMGSDRAGGDWDIVMDIISKEITMIDVVIVKL